MVTDFENTPLRDENGKIILDASGNPILYKYFLNDMNDEDDDDKEQISLIKREAEKEKNPGKH